MKKSEQLRQDARSAESDQGSLGLHIKAMREERAENFEEKWYDKLLVVFGTITSYDDGTRYTFYTQQHGHMTFYPKANKVLIHKNGLWKKPGLKWLIQTYLPKDK